MESLVEYRASWDPSSDPNAVRISIGVEDLEDLKADIRQALKHLVQVRLMLTLLAIPTDRSFSDGVQALKRDICTLFIDDYIWQVKHQIGQI